MSIFDEERKKLGLPTVGGSTPAPTKSIFDAERQQILNPPSISEQQRANVLRSSPDMGLLAMVDEPKPVVTQPSGQQPMYANDPTRQLPIIGPILRGLDAVANNPVVDKVAQIARDFYVPGAGAANVAGLSEAAGSVVSRLLPNLGNNLAGKVVQTATREAVTGAPLGAGQSLMVNPNESGADVAKNAALGAGFGAGLGAVGKAAGAGVSAIADKYAGTTIGDALGRMMGRTVTPQEETVQGMLALPAGEQRLGLPAGSPNYAYDRPIPQPSGVKQFASDTPIAAQGNIAEPLALPPSNYVRQTLKNASPEDYLGTVLQQIKPEVDAAITPPARRDLLINYIEQHLQVPRTEIHNMPMGDLQELGQEIRKGINVYDVASQVAAKRGYDLPSILEGKTPSISSRVAEDAQKRVYGIYPNELPSVVKPQAFARSVTGEAAAPLQMGFRSLKQANRAGLKGELPRSQEATQPSGVTRRLMQQAETPVQASEPRMATTTRPGEIKPAQTLVQGEKGIRANYANQLKNGNFSEPLQNMIRNTDQRYDIKTNASTMEQANQAVKNLSDAENKFMLNQSIGPEHIATGYRLMQELDALGEHARALKVSDKLAADLTRSGQTTQAASLIARLSPEGQLLNLVRTAQKNGKEVTVADSQKFKELAAEVQQASGAGIRANQFNEILNRLERGEKATPEDIKKLSDYLSSAEQAIKPKAPVEKLPPELKQPKKREKVISFLDDMEQAALARIASRRNQLNSLPINEWADHAIVVAAQIAKGTIRASTHVEDMVKMFGENIRPVATQVYEKAQGLLNGVSKSAAEGNLEKAQAAVRRLSGQASAEKAAVQEMSNHVRKLIADAKQGILDPADVQKLRDYADEIAEMTADKPKRIPTQEERFMQSVKSLAKKIAQVESEKVPSDQANREVSSLIRQVAKIADEGQPTLKKQPLDNKAISDIAHDVMGKTRPNPKPTTLQEKIVERYIKQNPKVSEKDISTLRELARNVTRLSGDQRIDADIAMQKILNSYEKSSAWDKLLAIRYMSMLLNTSTQLVNAASGPIMATTGYAADVLGVMVDIAMSKALKQPRTVTLYGSNPLAFMARYFKNLKVGARAGALGTNPAGIQSYNEIRGLAFKSPINPFGIAERALGAVSKGADYAAYKSVFDAELQKQGYLEAVNSGVKGKQNIRNYVEQYVNNPPEKAILQADRIGKNTTFQRSDSVGGKLANSLNAFPNTIKPIVTSVMPFVRTPINMAFSAVDMTPAGLIKGLYQLLAPTSDATKREAIRTLSLGVMGSFGLSSLAYYLDRIGVLTGANDSGDRDVDAIREQAGGGKYRFNTSALARYLEAMFNGEGEAAAEKAAKFQQGDKTFDYNKLQPLAFPMSIGASLAENAGKPIVDRVTTSGSDAFGSLFNMSSLKGVQDVFQPQYGGTLGEKSVGVLERIAESFFKSFSPSLLAQEARRQDPIVRQTTNTGLKEDVTSYFKSRTPGLSQSLPPRKTTLGMNTQNPQGITGQYLNPYNSNVATYNEAAAVISGLIDRTGDKALAPSVPSKKVSGRDSQGKQITVDIPPDRYTKLQEEVGNEIVKRVMQINPSLSDAQKAEALKRIYSTAREMANAKVKRELGVR